MKKRNKKLIQWLVIIAGILTLLKVYYETKMLDLTMGILGLEFGNKDIHRVSCKSLMYIAKEDTDGQAFLDEMASKGFMAGEVYGRGHLFVKDGEEILVIEKVYWNRYKVYEIQNKHYFLSFEEA